MITCVKKDTHAKKIDNPNRIRNSGIGKLVQSTRMSIRGPRSAATAVRDRILFYRGCIIFKKNQRTKTQRVVKLVGLHASALESIKALQKQVIASPIYSFFFLFYSYIFFDIQMME